MDQHPVSSDHENQRYIITLLENGKLLAWTLITKRWTVLTELPLECQSVWTESCSAKGMIVVSGGKDGQNNYSISVFSIR